MPVVSQHVCGGVWAEEVASLPSVLSSSTALGGKRLSMDELKVTTAPVEREATFTHVEGSLCLL